MIEGEGEAWTEDIATTSTPGCREGAGMAMTQVRRGTTGNSCTQKSS